MLLIPGKTEYTCHCHQNAQYAQQSKVLEFFSVVLEVGKKAEEAEVEKQQRFVRDEGLEAEKTKKSEEAEPPVRVLLFF